jgi:ABC-type glycerol-3-phosphate transport system substrate-binding protein
VRDELVYPLEGLIPSSILGNLYDVGLDLGQVDGAIYGLPYLLDTRVTAYHQDSDEETTSASWSFEDMLNRGDEWIFPASRVGGIGNILYVQYLDAGGRAPSASLDTFQVDADALSIVFGFYEQGIEQGVINERVLEFTSYDAYVTDLMDENLNHVTLTSNRYIELRSQNADLFAAAIPTVSGQATGPVDGWMWVLTTSNADQQALAANFINWMMSPARQQAYAEISYMLPSQQSPLRNYDADLLDSSLFDAILNGAMRIPSDTNSLALSRAMQNALISMLTGDSSAEDAVDMVINQFSS